MNTKILALTAIVAVFALSGCGNTLGGVGQDLEGAGKWMQKKSNR